MIPQTVNNRKVTWLVLMPALALGLTFGCNSTKSGGGGTGGSSSGGTSGSGGSSAHGGSGGTSNGGSGGTSSGGAGGTASGGAGGTASGGAGGTVSGGAGGTASGGAGGTAAGGAGGTATGGTTPGTGGSGGSTSVATGLSCTDPVYGSVSIPAVNVISDFENNSLLQYAQDGRGVGALPWYAYSSNDATDPVTNIMTTVGSVNPLNAANTFAIDTTQHGPCSTKGALHVTSPGDSKGTGGYCGFGIDFMARTTAAAKKKLAYDASKYTGVGFWAKCSSDLQFAFTKTVDAVHDADVDSSIVPTTCSYAANTCNQYGIKNAAITKDWSYYKLYFSELLQDPNGTTFTPAVDKSKLMAFQIHVNPLSPRSGTPAANKFDCYIDDVHFLSEAAPPPTSHPTWFPPPPAMLPSTRTTSPSSRGPA
jgi:hypothetical protein